MSAGRTFSVYAFVITVALHITLVLVRLLFMHYRLHNTTTASLVIVLVVITSTRVVVGVNDDVE